MSEPSAVTRSRIDTAQRALGWSAWLLMGAGLVALSVIRSVSGIQVTEHLLVVLGMFFVLLVLRLGLVAWVSPGRRLTLALLAAALGFWGAGSVAVNSARLDGEVTFPGPGEWLFLLAYVGMAGWVLRDINRRPGRMDRAWLDIAVICGGTYCLAALLVVTPVQAMSGLQGTALLLALIYPLADVALALVVLGQAILALREDRTKTVLMGLGFLLWAVADSGFALELRASTYEFGNSSNLLWGCAFAFLVSAACRPAKTVIRVVPRAPGTVVLVGAGAAALGVLTVRPDDSLIWYTMPAALLTMAAVAGRLGVALRDANRANEAFALSQTDDLTKLPNRRAVRAWLADPEIRSRPLALMMLDLDRFKEINDSLGHRAGDTVLTLIALRMREAVAHDVRVARLGGDEFALLLDTTDDLELMGVARGVLDELAKPIEVDGIEISPSGSIGITVASAGEEGSELLRRADVAMYQAKNTEVGVAVYDAELDEFSRSRLQLAEEVRRALAEDQIEVWYQPQVDPRSMEVCGLEALVRWRHPTQGLLGPVSFLPAARRAGLMGQLSDIVVRQAMRDVVARREAGHELRVSINCAPPELLGPSFLPALYASLEEWQVPSDLIVLEVTEESLLADPQRARDLLLELREHGVEVSIDDYGTGFSSLTYLRNLPVEELKIDRSLIGNVATDHRTQMIVQSTIGLAHALDLRIVAEGVENEEDLNALVDMGIDVVQGYHLGRPMSSDQLAVWMRDRTSTSTEHTDDHDRQEIR